MAFNLEILQNINYKNLNINKVLYNTVIQTRCE